MKEIQVKEWTIMFYFASDNPLASTIVSQLKAIKDAGFHQQANVIAYFDPQPENVASHVFDVNLVEKLKQPERQRFSFAANDPFVRNLVFDRLWREKDEDTKKSIRDYLNKYNNIKYDSKTVPDTLVSEQASERSLPEFLEFCRINYPARHYMLILLGHGVVVGNDIFLFDANIPDPEKPALDSRIPQQQPDPNAPQADPSDPNASSNGTSRQADSKDASGNKDLSRHSLTLQDLGKALEAFKKAIGRDSELELLGLHSCSMSALEVAYEIQGTANYLLASQGPAFVGSWPYKQILTRVFNDLDPSFDADDFNSAALIANLNKKDNEYLISRFQDRDILTQNNDTRKFHSALTDELNGLLNFETLCQSAWANGIRKSAETKRLKNSKPEGTDLMWLNRMLLQDALQDAFKDGKKKLKGGVKEMLIKIFYFCIHNSYDFQLAGYSFDMALCDLSKLKDDQQGVTVPLQKLSSALIEGLKETDESVKDLIKGLILLAHWDAQSFWQEQYTDLYDFCFCLNRRSKDYAETNPAVKKISTACDGITTVLERGKENDDNRLIVRSEFIGPAFQYSRGLSVFFPWTEPVDKTFLPRYADYKFTTDFDPGSGWIDFLKTYFAETKRKFRSKEEKDDLAAKNKPITKPEMELQLLAVLQNITNTISSSDARLDGLPGKVGSGDPTGDNCDCPSIKNYPSSTDTFTKDEAEKVETGLKAAIGLNIAEHLR